MNRPIEQAVDRADRGRFVLRPEDPAVAAATADPRRPRIRRYRLARVATDGVTRPIDASRRPPVEFGYLRRAHD